MASNIALISKQEWVNNCKNSYGETKKTYDAIRWSQGYFGNKATCAQAYNRLAVHDTFLAEVGVVNLNRLEISDLNPLSGFPIFTLHLSNNNIIDLKPLAGSDHLIYLNLGSNRIWDISPLASLKCLERLNISYNNISDLSPLNELANLVYLNFENNKISDICPLAKLHKLLSVYLKDNEISDFSHLGDHVIICGKEEQNGMHTSSSREEVQNETISCPFYEKLMEITPNTLALLTKLNDIPDLITDVHQIKFYYSFVMYYFRTGSLDTEERNGYIRNGLEKAASVVSDSDAIADYKAILRKAVKDGIITQRESDKLDNDAEDVKTSHMPFIRDLQEAVRTNTIAVKGLEGNIQALQKNIVAVNQSLNNVKRGMQRKIAIESGVSFMGAVLNAVSLGFAGSALQAISAFSVSDIVDFSDFPHMQEIAENVGFGEAFSHVQDTVNETDLSGVLGVGLDRVDGTSDDELGKAVEENTPLIIIAAIAAKIDTSNIQQRSSDIPMAHAVPAHAVTNSPKYKEASFDDYDSGFESDDEDDYPLHAAIKYGDLELLNEELDNCANVNLIDQRGRSPADYAAIKGEEKMMKLILEMGGSFKSGSKAKMRKVCHERINKNK